MPFKVSTPIRFTLRKAILILSSLFSLLALNSCYSYKVYPKENRNIKNTKQRETVYVINDSLEKELKILEKSTLFTITKDSTQTDIKIKLYPIKQYPGCGNPLIGHIITLGQIPVYLPNQYEYRFDRIQKGKIESENLNISLTKRYWFWDMFTFSKNFEKKAGQALLVKYQENKN